MAAGKHAHRGRGAARARTHAAGALFFCLSLYACSSTGSAAAAPAAGGPSCAARTTPDTCFKVVGTTFLRNLTSPSVGGCCASCTSDAKCVAFQWNYATPAQAALCILVAAPAVPKVKTPVHPAQKACTVGVMPPPPDPPLPPSPPGAKSVLYVLVDDLRTQLTPYGHSTMHTPNIAKFATSPNAVVFRQAHCNSQMCVPTRNSFMTGRR